MLKILRYIIYGPEQPIEGGEPLIDDLESEVSYC